VKVTTLLVSFKVIKGNCFQTFFNYIIEFRLLYAINYCNDYFSNNNTDTIMCHAL